MNLFFVLYCFIVEQEFYTADGWCYSAWVNKQDLSTNVKVCEAGTPTWAALMSVCKVVEQAKERGRYFISFPGSVSLLEFLWGAGAIGEFLWTNPDLGARIRCLCGELMCFLVHTPGSDPAADFYMSSETLNLELYNQYSLPNRNLRFSVDGGRLSITGMGHIFRDVESLEVLQKSETLS
jgi:hypothetical protein